MTTARAVCIPANLALVLGVVLAWSMLVTWTGASPAGWQARLCVKLDQRPRSCGDVRPGKDESRVLPHAAAARPPS